MFEKQNFTTTKCSISPLHFFFPFQEGDHSIIRMEEYIRNFGQEHIKTTRRLYIRVPTPYRAPESQAISGSLTLTKIHTFHYYKQ